MGGVGEWSGVENWVGWVRWENWVGWSEVGTMGSSLQLCIIRGVVHLQHHKCLHLHHTSAAVRCSLHCHGNRSHGGVWSYPKAQRKKRTKKQNKNKSSK